jgi:hypothetical protein
MKIDIHGVHLTKANALSVSYKETEGENQAPVTKGPFTAPVHEDLILSVSKMDIHLAVMSGQVGISQVNIKKPGDVVEGFHAKSYAFTGAGDKKKGVIISGNRVLENGKVFNFNTPNYLIEENETTRYPFMDQLLKAIDRVNVEALAFMDGTKRGTEAQGKLPFENGSKTTVQILKPEGPDGEWTAEQYKAATNKKGIPVADPEAMERVKAEYEDAHVVNEGTEPGKRKVLPPAGKTNKKRVQQTPDNRSGIVEEGL